MDSNYLETLHTERQLAEKQHQAQLSAMEEQLVAKTAQYTKLMASFKYLHEEKESLAEKAANQAQIHQTQQRALSNTVSRQKEENFALSRAMAELESKYTRLNSAHKQTVADLAYQVKAADALSAQIERLNASVAGLQRQNEDLLSRSLSAHNEHSSRVSVSLQAKNAQLQKTNNALQLKIDRLLQQKTTNELLKHKNASLVAKVTQYERDLQRYAQMEIDHMRLKTKYASLGDQSVQEVASHVRQVECDLAVARESLGKTVAEVVALKKSESDCLSKIDALSAALRRVQGELTEREKRVAVLERTKILNDKEIEYLRREIEVLAKEGESEYVKNLEKLVDDYKRMNEKKKNENDEKKNEEKNEEKKNEEKKNEEKKNDEKNNVNGEKNDEKKNENDKIEAPTENKSSTAIAVEEDENKSSTANAVEDSSKRPYNDVILHEENLHLLSKVRVLELRIADLQNQLASSEKVREKHFSVLQMKENPCAKALLIRQELVDALRQENADLVSKSGETVPRSVFERQEADKQALQVRINQLAKRIARLRSAYAQKSKDILSMVSKYFGYVVEFVPSATNPEEISSRVKLSPKGGEGYLMVDMELRSLRAYGGVEFKEVVGRVMGGYGLEEISLFLGSLVIELANRAKRGEPN